MRSKGSTSVIVITLVKPVVLPKGQTYDDLDSNEKQRVHVQAEANAADGRKVSVKIPSSSILFKHSNQFLRLLEDAKKANQLLNALTNDICSRPHTPPTP